MYHLCGTVVLKIEVTEPAPESVEQASPEEAAP